MLELLGDTRGADRVLAFFRGCLTHVDGEWASRPFDPLPFQIDIIRGLFDPATMHGYRRIRKGLIFVPRKCGKTTLAAGLGLYMTFADEIGGQVVCAANSRDQAALLFQIAAAMVEASPVLSARAMVSRARKTIKDRITGTTFRAIAADAGKQHGLNLTCWIYDELHAATDRELLDVLDTATGARRQPLGLMISTAGFDKMSPLGEEYEYGTRVLADPSMDQHYYAFIAEAAESDPWDDERTWRKANPAAGEFRNLEELRIKAGEARQKPAMIETFKRLYLNMWTAADSTWLDMDAWDSCNGSIPDEELSGAECFGGLDLSVTTDLTAFVLLFEKSGNVYLRHWAWLPGEGVREREARDRVPYSRWAHLGLIELTPGPVIDHARVIARIKEAAARYDIQRIHFDKWGSPRVVADLEEAGIRLVEHSQNFAGMTAATKEFERAVLDGRLQHGGCPLLRWQAAAVTVRQDDAGNIKPVKPDRLRYAKKIDSIVAAIMALDGLMRCSTRDTGGFLTSPIIV